VPMFEVQYTISGRVAVDCDDEKDAQEFVECAGVEALFGCGRCGTAGGLSQDVRVASVTALHKKSVRRHRTKHTPQ
jgi:hypothetical protein